jgi:hypothetical protein
MPLLEIVQTRQISATIRLDESTAEQIDQPLRRRTTPSVCSFNAKT